MRTDIYSCMAMRMAGIVCGVCCVGYAQTESREAQMLRAEFSAFAQKMSPSGEGFWFRDLFEPCKRMDGLTNKLEAASLVKSFEDEILQIDMSRMPYRDRGSRIQFIFNAATLAVRHFPDKGREYWTMRLRALAWAKDEIDRFGDDGPAKDPEMKARLEKDPLLKNLSQFIDRKKDPTGRFDNWWHCFGVLKERFRDFVGDAVYEIEGAQPEFRGWVRGEIEKIVGHPLTDADFGDHGWQIIEERKEQKRRAHDAKVRKPYDGGDVLPHPFTFFGCVLGSHYELSKPISKYTHGDEILYWYRNLAIEPYFGKVRMLVSLAPRSKIAFGAKISWSEFDGLKTREDVRTRAKDIKSDIEKRLGVKLGEFFFESGRHVCDEAAWWKADGATAWSRSEFGPIRIEIEAIDDPTKCHPRKQIVLTITDTAAEALVEKERKENPLTFDSKAEKEAERRRIERLKELGRQRKAMKDAQKPPQP